MRKHLVYIILISVLLVTVKLMYDEKEKYEKLYSIEAANYKASIDYNNGEIRSLNLTINQLKYQQDETIHKLDSVRKLNKIKDSRIESLLYTKQEVHIKDTIIFKDTVFVKDLYVDTTLSNKYRTLNLRLEYPSTITDSLVVYNEHYFISSYRKETIKPRKKFFLFRWFQKKHLIGTYIIEDSNPFIKSDSSKFIKIIK